jgi:RimJ/RimL family protein N-acetyltransferase
MLRYPDPALSDGVVRLRPWAQRDLACVREAADDPRIPAGSTVPAVFTLDGGRAFVERQRARLERREGVSLTIAIAATDEALGLAVLLLRPQPGVAGIGYWVVPRARRRGLATRAVRLLSGWALLDAGLARVEAWAEPGNLASQRVLSGAGFVREGVLRSFLTTPEGRSDAIVFSRTTADTGATSARSGAP